MSSPQRPIFGPIDTDRLKMRHYLAEDVELVLALMSDPSVMRYYHELLDREQSKKVIANALVAYEKFGYSVLATERKSDGLYIGHVGLLHWDDVDAREDVEVAYMLLPEFWGCGYATEAARASRDWAFTHLGVDRVVSFIAVENEPSMRVAERNGMVRLKRRDENRFGQPMYVYGIARAAWRDHSTA